MCDTEDTPYVCVIRYAICMCDTEHEREKLWRQRQLNVCVIMCDTPYVCVIRYALCMCDTEHEREKLWRQRQLKLKRHGSIVAEKLADWHSERFPYCVLNVSVSVSVCVRVCVFKSGKLAVWFWHSGRCF